MLAKLPAPQKLLFDAADLIEERGWCQHTRQDESGAMCILGAISVAHDGDAHSQWSTGPAGSLMASYLGTSPAPWNNEFGRTKEEVVAAMRAAALSA